MPVGPSSLVDDVIAISAAAADAPFPVAVPSAAFWFGLASTAPLESIFSTFVPLQIEHVKVFSPSDVAVGFLVIFPASQE